MLELRMPSIASEPPVTVSLMRARLSISLLSSEPARWSNALANSATRSSKAALTWPIVACRRSSNKPERRSRSTIASSALDCRLWRKAAPRSSSVALSLASTRSSELVIPCSPVVRLSASSRVRSASVSFSWRARSPSAALSFSVLASSVEARVSNSPSSSRPRSCSVPVSCCRRVSNSLASEMPEALSVWTRFSVLLDRRLPIEVAAASDFSIRAAARVSISEAKASPEVARRTAISSVASDSSSLSCSWAPTIELRMRSAWLTMASRSEPSSWTRPRTRNSLSV